MTELVEVLTGEEAVAGLLPGAAALAVGALVGALARARHRPPVPVAGLLVAAALVVALDAPALEAAASGPSPPERLVAGLAALAIGGLLVDLVPRLRLAAPLLALPGAALVAAAVPLEDAGGGWVRVAVAACVALGGTATGELDRRWRSAGLGPVLFAVSAAGVAGTVPDTEQAAALLVIALLVVPLGWPFPLAGLGHGGALAAVGALAWVVGTGGAARDGAVVGGLACLGLLVVEPVAHVLVRRRSAIDALPRQPQLRAVAAGVVHLPLVFVASRVAGLREGADQAAVVAGLALLASVALAVALTPPTRRGRPA